MSGSEGHPGAARTPAPPRSAESSSEKEAPPSAGRSPDPGTDGDGDGGPGLTRRFWSDRRVPAALLALVLSGCAGALLYDIAAVRAERAALPWRRALARELAHRPLDDGWVTAAALAAVAAGTVLVVLAVTPGLRRLLPMRRGTPSLRAGLDRTAAALVLRNRALEVSGVQSVRVDVGRRRVTARARSHFRPLEEVRADVETVLEEGIRQLGLARQPGLRVLVRRPAKR